MLLFHLDTSLFNSILILLSIHNYISKIFIKIKLYRHGQQEGETRKKIALWWHINWPYKDMPVITLHSIAVINLHALHFLNINLYFFFFFTRSLQIQSIFDNIGWKYRKDNNKSRIFNWRHIYCGRWTTPNMWEVFFWIILLNWVFPEVGPLNFQSFSP